jgi:hypothetical protein
MAAGMPASALIASSSNASRRRVICIVNVIYSNA